MSGKRSLRGPHVLLLGKGHYSARDPDWFVGAEDGASPRKPEVKSENAEDPVALLTQLTLQNCSQETREFTTLQLHQYRIKGAPSIATAYRHLRESVRRLLTHFVLLAVVKPLRARLPVTKSTSILYFIATKFLPHHCHL